MMLLRVSWMVTPPGRMLQQLNFSLMALFSRLVSRDSSTSCTVSADVDLQNRDPERILKQQQQQHSLKKYPEFQMPINAAENP